jgi:hypothetical protein
LKRRSKSGILYLLLFHGLSIWYGSLLSNNGHSYVNSYLKHHFLQSWVNFILFKLCRSRSKNLETTQDRVLHLTFKKRGGRDFHFLKFCFPEYWKICRRCRQVFCNNTVNNKPCICKTFDGE